MGIIIRGFRAFSAKFGQNHPCPIGKLIYNKPPIESSVLASSRVFGWHAGPFSKLEQQIYNGKFDKNYKDIYFGNKYITAHFGGLDHDSKMLLICAPMDTPVDVNEQFNTNYFPAGEDQDVYILAAHDINPEWKKFVSNSKNRPKLSEIFFASLKKSIEAFNK